MREAAPKSIAIVHPVQRAHALVADAIERVEFELDVVARSTVSLIPEVAHHLIGSGGKRLRPTLLLLFAGSQAARQQEATALAVAAELIHNSTLLHDDVVDRGHLRRGVPAAPVIYGNAASVLVGDFLMARAFGIVVEHGDQSLLQELSQVVSGMAEGEVMQMVRTSRVTLSQPEYEQVIAGKTAGLFSWSCRAGASLNPAAAIPIGKAAEFGRAFGMAFQVADDILDYTASVEESGKDLANDLTQGKMTLPLLLACEEDPDLLLIVEAQATAEPQLDECLRIVQRVLETRAIPRSLDRARSYSAQALTILERQKRDPVVDCLCDLTRYVVERAGDRSSQQVLDRAGSAS